MRYGGPGAEKQSIARLDQRAVVVRDALERVAVREGDVHAVAEREPERIEILDRDLDEDAVGVGAVRHGAVCEYRSSVGCGRSCRG